jgi:hypothetical protein
MKTAISGFLLLLFAVKEGSAQTEDLIFYRIEILCHTKKQVMNRIWPGVADPAYTIPLIYFTDSACYIVNPTQRFMEQYDPILRYRNEDILIFKVPERIDSIPFHMEASTTDDPQQYNYELPFAKITGLEQAKKLHPSITVETWAGMVLHELFHGYQFQHRAFYKHAYDTKAVYPAINDTLQSFYKKYDWFKKDIDEENAMILEAIREDDHSKRDSLIVKMLSVRDGRRARVAKDLQQPVDFYEKYFETTEGTARYIEARMNEHFQKLNIASRMDIAETNEPEPVPVKGKRRAASSGGKTVPAEPVSKTIISADPDGPEWVYKTEASQLYTYATGYNLARLLDKLAIDYKKRLFREPQLTLEDILRKQYEVAD